MATINRGDSSVGSSSFTQLNQQLYVVGARSGSVADFVAKDDPINYQGSQSGSPLVLAPQSGSWNWEGAGDLITLEDGDRCVKTELKLLAPSGGNTPSAPNSTAASDTCPWMTQANGAINSASVGEQIRCTCQCWFVCSVRLPSALVRTIHGVNYFRTTNIKPWHCLLALRCKRDTSLKGCAILPATTAPVTCVFAITYSLGCCHFTGCVAS